MKAVDLLSVSSESLLLSQATLAERVRGSRDLNMILNAILVASYFQQLVFANWNSEQIFLLEKATFLI